MAGRLATPPGSGGDAEADGGRGEAGFVLVSVLFAIVLVAGVTALLVNLAGTAARADAAFLRNAEAEAAADGAIRAVAVRLAFGGAGEAGARDGAWSRCRLFDDVVVAVSVQDQDGLVDSVAAPDALRGRVLAALAPSERAAGAERRPDLLTRFSGSDGFDPAVAPAALLRLFGAGGVPAEFVRPTRGRIFAVAALAGERGRGIALRRAVVELIRRPDQPYAVRDWGSAAIPEDWPSTLPAAASPC